MATSGNTDYSETALSIIKDAYITLGVYREDETPDASDNAFANRILNRMVKRWQAQGNHLWTKETATIFLEKEQTEYILGPSGDNVTTSYIETSLAASYPAGTSQFVFNDNVAASVDDYIGIVIDNNSLYWDIITNVISPTTVEVGSSIFTTASENNNVYIYTNKIDTPFNVYSAVRTSNDEIDTPMFQMSYEEYFQQPNKTSLSTPVNYRYDRQRSSTKISVWPTPADVTYRMQITYARKIEDFDQSVNEPDFPQEWYDALVLNLSAHPSLAVAHGKAGSQQYQELKLAAKEALAEALLFDNEPGSIYLQPEYER